MIHFYKEVLKFQMFYCFDMNFIFIFLLFSWKPGFHLNYSVDSQKKNLKKQKRKKQQQRTDVCTTSFLETYL